MRRGNAQERPLLTTPTVQRQNVQSITLVASWRGGPGIDVVSIVHNGSRIAAEDRRIQVDPASVRIEYQCARSAVHRVQAAFSFIGDLRTQLALYCLVDGAMAGGPIQFPRAEHRWEVQGAWTPYSR